MKILMLVNWKVEYCNEKLTNKQPPDYYQKNEPYWFFRYFNDIPDIDIIDIGSFSTLEKFEKNKLHFHIWQAIKAIPKLNRYDLVISHGMPSGVVIALWRRFFKTKCKHLVFDIGSFNSAAETGIVLKLMQFVSKSLDGVIYHTSLQQKYYKNFFPWLVNKSYFIKYGVDFEFFGKKKIKHNKKQYIVCVGKNLSDWDTVVKAFEKIENKKINLRFIGGYDEKYAGEERIEQFPFMKINDLVKMIEGAELCVLPLQYVKYSFGQMRFLQQQALGKCVIASKIPSLVDYAIEGKTAFFYQPGNYMELTKIINYLLENKDIKEKVGENAYEVTKEEYNEKKMAHNIERVIKEILD